MYDERDRDCIEGYKLADRKLPCQSCGGDGKFHVQSFAYNFVEHSAEVMEERDDRKKINDLIGRLEAVGITVEDIDLIEAYHAYRYSDDLDKRRKGRRM